MDLNMYMQCLTSLLNSSTGKIFTAYIRGTKNSELSFDSQMNFYCTFYRIINKTHFPLFEMLISENISKFWYQRLIYDIDAITQVPEKQLKSRLKEVQLFKIFPFETFGAYHDPRRRIFVIKK